MPGLAAVAPAAPFSRRECGVLDDALTDLAWSRDGRWLVAGSANGTLYRFDDQGSPLAEWPAHRGGITRVCPRPGADTTLASAGEDGRVLLWDRAEDGVPHTLIEQNDWVEHLAWTPDGGVLAAAARKSISLWRDTESLGIWYDARRHILAMAWAPDGRRLATAGNKGLFLWRLDRADSDDVEPARLLSFPGAPVAVAWQPGGAALAVGTQDGFLQLWRPSSPGRSGRQLTMRGYPGKVNCLAWHPLRPVIATAGGPDVVLWELPRDASGARGKPLRHHPATVTAVAWSDDGTLLASGDRHGRLCIWDHNGDPVFSQSIEREIAALQWQPGHRSLAIGDTGGHLHLVEHTADEESSINGSINEETHR